MKYRSAAPTPQLPRRTLDYLERGATEGRRNAELFDAACQFRDAGIAPGEAEERLMARALADGLTENEARTTMRSALAQGARAAIHHGSVANPPQQPAPPLKPELRPKFVPEPMDLPPPVEGGFVRMLETCFRADEFVAIAPASEDDDGNIVPKRGVTLTASDWRKRVESKGGIERCFSTKLGLFVRLNPMIKDGAKNDEVTAFRHVLVEFDRDVKGELIPKEVQFGAIVSSGFPVSVVIDSGNKSLHAWVRVDAPDANEYSRRVGVIWDWLEGLSLDKQNKNPSRLSRCPDGWRTVDGEPRQQRLLAVNIGAKSWEEWESDREHEDLGEPIRLSDLATYDVANDPNNVLGQRWLCRSSSLVIVGQSGVGKSSICMQLMILWALGLPAFGIAPIRPLSSLLIQAENDKGDLAEMYQGVRSGMNLTKDQDALLDENITIFRNTTHTGDEFTSLAERLVTRYKPDLVWTDPLLNYIGDDISEQKVIANFCCKKLNSIALKTGVIWCLLHHTGKPSKDPKASSHWTASDLAYSGLGSSALVNWSRETAVLVRTKVPDGYPPTFQLSMTKRRKRAGLKTPAGEAADTIFLQHRMDGSICWEQCEAPPQTRESSGGKYRTAGRPSAYDMDAFRTAIIAAGGKVTTENVEEIAGKMCVVERTIWNWWKKHKDNLL